MAIQVFVNDSVPFTGELFISGRVPEILVELPICEVGKLAVDIE